MFGVSFDNLRHLLRVAGEARDLPQGSKARRERALDGLGALIGARVGLWGHAELDRTTGMRIGETADVGFGDHRERETFHSYVSGGQSQWPDPSLATMMRRFDGSVFSGTRTDLLDDREWYSSPHVQELRRAADVDGFVFSLFGADDGTVYFVSFHRPWNDRPFSTGERDLVHAFHSACTWIHAPSPADVMGRLPPRLRDTLQGLLQGQSEKEIASALGLSAHTVHDYVKALHRRFRVASRGELLARFLAR